jgi:hypothetical protein
VIALLSDEAPRKDLARRGGGFYDRHAAVGRTVAVVEVLIRGRPGDRHR